MTAGSSDSAARIASRWRLAVVGLVLTTPLLVAGGYWYYVRELAEVKAERYRSIHAIAELQTTELQRWRSDLLTHVAGAATAEGLSRALSESQRDQGRLEARETLELLLGFVRGSHGFEGVVAVDAAGALIAQAGNDVALDREVTRRALADARTRGRAVISELYRSPAGHVVIDAVAPMGGGASLVFRVHVSTTIDPLLANWPIPSASAETVLLRREGDGVLVLNELRHRAGTALSMRIPLADRTRPATQAALGTEGWFEGIDYRGVRVVADLRAVDGTPWFIVAKMDEAEILGDARERATAIAAVVGLLLACVLSFAGFLHRRAQAVVLGDLYAAEKRAGESEQRFQTTVYSIGDAVITTDLGGAVREMNRVAERLTGWSEAEGRGRPLAEVFRIVDEGSRETRPSPADTALRDGTVVELANHTLLIARDGTEVPIADSAAPIRDRDGAVTGVVLVFSDQTATHEARQRLEESEERLRLALRSANQGLYDLDVRTGETAVSPEYATMLGYDPATFRETHDAWLERLHPDDRTHVAQAYRDCLEGRTAEYRAEFRQRTADEGWTWTLSLGRIVARAPDGAPLRMLGTHTDITSLKVAEARIVRLSQLYATLSQCNQAIVRSANERELFPQICEDAVRFGGMRMAWIGLVEPDSRRVVVAASYGDEHHYLDGLDITIDPEDVTGRGPTATAIREHRPCWCNDFLAEPATAPWHGRATDAGLRASAALPLCRHGMPVGALMLYSSERGAFDAEAQKLLIEMSNDISFALDSFERERARERAEVEKEAIRRQLEATLDAVPDLMFEVDLDGRFVACHTPRVDQLAAPPEVFMGRTVAEVLTADVSDVVMDAIREASEAGHTTGASYELDTPGGRKWFELSISRKAMMPGEPVRLVVLARDVTERKHAEQQRDFLEVQLRQSQKMEAIGQLAGGIAHDFNNLLTIINGRADLALGRLEPADALHEDLVDIRNAGERAAVLTRQLLTFSRRQVDVPQVIAVQAGIGGMQSMLRRLISEEIRLTVTVAADAGAVRIAAGQLEQVVLNLVLNARDAMPNGGSLGVDAHLVHLSAADASAITSTLGAGPFVRLSVTDSGVGMDEATCARCFEPFFTTKGLGKGTGLGLSTVYAIVRQAGGGVTVRSAPGHGTRFDVYLPHVDPSAATSLPVGAATVEGGTGTILVVDDEQALVTIASRILRTAGYSVLSARDGIEALAVLATHPGRVDLLLTDVVIPGMSGRELAERVRATYPDIRVLFSSGYTDDEVLRKGVESSQAHFIGKPYSVGDLTRKVRDVLRPLPSAD